MAKKTKSAKKKKPTKKAARKPAKKGVKKAAKKVAPKRKLLVGLTLKDFVIDPDHHDLSTSPQTKTIEAEIVLRGNDAPDTFVVQMSQPRSDNWVIDRPLEHRFSVDEGGTHHIAWQVTLRLASGGSYERGETFLVDCRGFLQSDSNRDKLRDIEFTVG